HEKKRKRRHADVGHRIDALALPLVRKSGAGVLEAAQKPVENQHPDLESENGLREHQKNRQPQRPFRIADSGCDPTQKNSETTAPAVLDIGGSPISSIGARRDAAQLWLCGYVLNFSWRAGLNGSLDGGLGSIPALRSADPSGREPRA